MNLYQSIISFFKSQGSESTPQGLCPNCWGRQEYGDKFYQAALNSNVDFNKPDPKLGWIQSYVDQHIEKIQLKKHDDELVCQNCKIVYRPSDL